MLPLLTIVYYVDYLIYMFCMLEVIPQGNIHTEVLILILKNSVQFIVVFLFLFWGVDCPTWLCWYNSKNFSI